MNGFLMKAGLGTAMAATALAAAAPAEAQRWRPRGYDRGGDVAAGALIGGVIGLGLGAAIASSNDRGRWGGYGYDGYYDRYDRRGWAPRRYYNNYRYNYRPRCFQQWRYDPYYGGRVPVRICR
ncbi:hypothetical protein CA236_06395 [Sphingomonas sp. ABOLG]|jgi:hypothetical protein|uniref:hypothetical protein n=1 Tax=unclassified Sphingomonas TaxID=196159 RepID=UPI000F7DE66E|nr:MULTISPECIES: hypothetical protein [unclassified Sphingomonas]MDF2603401.1 hypothetical protein [Sphingomonas sp.]RSV18851.1 hypothetical protein CA236_06395 [Sphingomonas sp. ABOLG]